MRLQISIITTPPTAPPTATGLIGEWNFDSNTLANTGSSGYLHDGTEVGTLTYEAANFSAGFDSGQALNVTNGYISINYTDSDIGGYLATFDQTSFSVSLWMMMDAASGAWTSLADKGNPGANTGSGWDLRRGNVSDTLRLDVLILANVVSYANMDLFPSTEWHHIVMTVDTVGSNTTVSTYLDNGTAKTITLSSTYVPTVADALNFGQISGLIDEIKFYDRVLTTEEVANLHYYNSENAPPPAGTVILIQ